MNEDVHFKFTTLISNVCRSDISTIIVGTSLKFTPEQIAYLVTVDVFYVWCSNIFTS